MGVIFLSEYRSYVVGLEQINSILRRSAICRFSIGLDMWKRLRGTKINYDLALNVPNLLPNCNISIP